MPIDIVPMVDFASKMSERAVCVPMWSTIVGSNRSWTGYDIKSYFRGERVIFGAPVRERFDEFGQVTVSSAT